MAEKILEAAILRRGKLTGLEARVWRFLGEKKNPWGFIPQFPLHGYILDFFSPVYNVALEADGPTHVNRKEADLRRDKILSKNGIETMRITPAVLSLGGQVKFLEYVKNFMCSVGEKE